MTNPYKMKTPCITNHYSSVLWNVWETLTWQTLVILHILHHAQVSLSFVAEEQGTRTAVLDGQVAFKCSRPTTPQTLCSNERGTPEDMYFGDSSWLLQVMEIISNILTLKDDVQCRWKSGAMKSAPFVVNNTFKSWYFKPQLAAFIIKNIQN